MPQNCTAGPLLPPPVPNATLISLFLFLRHGSRAPSGSYGAPTLGGNWQCGHRFSSHTRVPIVNGIPRNFSFNESEYHVYTPACRGGQLLDIGFDELVILGSKYRDYLTRQNPILPRDYDPRLVQVRSTFVPRAAESAVAFLEGLYPPDNGGVLNILQSNDSIDELLPGLHQFPPRVYERIDEFAALDELKDVIERAQKEYLPIYNQWNFSIVDVRGLVLAADVFLSCRCGGEYKQSILPVDTLESMERDVKKLGRGYYRFLGQEGFKPIWKMLVRQLDAYYGMEESFVFRLFCGHDTTLFAVLVGLNLLDDDVELPYASHLGVELWHGKQTFVRFVLNGNVLKVKGEYLTLLSQFKEWANCEYYSFLSLLYTL
jgi:hypothetical protein